jgi:hypothetical protein
VAEVVRLVFGAGKDQVRHKIAYRHRDLRDVVDVTGKSVVDLLNDPFGGWPYLLQFGRRQYDPKVTKDQASDLIDAWLDDHPDNEFSKIGDLLMQALENSKFIKFPKATESKAGEEEAVPEGNAPTQTTTDL